MIHQVLLLSLFAIASASIPYEATNYGISPSVETYSARPQPYNINIDVTDEYGAHQNRREEGDDLGNKRGSYGFVDAFGIARQVDYVADDQGFRAVVRTNEPGTESQNPADVEIISNAAQIPVPHQTRANIPAVSQPTSVYEQAPGRQGSVYEQAPGRQASVYEQGPGRQVSVYEQAPGRQASVYEQAPGRQASVYEQASGRQASAYEQSSGRQASAYEQATGRSNAGPSAVSESSPSARQSVHEQNGGRLTVTPASGVSPVFRQSVPVYERPSGRINVVSVPVSRVSPVYRQQVPAYENASGRINGVSVPATGVSSVYRQSVPAHERNVSHVSRESPANRQAIPAHEQATGRFNTLSVSGGSSIVRQPLRQVHSASATVRAPSSSSLSSPHIASLNRAGLY